MTQPGGPEEVDSALEELLIFIRDARGFDFTGYKRSSLARRIRKRMQEVGAADYVDYRDLLESSAEEFGHLFNTILINVTGFFRDTETWTYLQRGVMPELLAENEGPREIRVWSAGCASGEEAYSLAIAFAEALGIEETRNGSRSTGQTSTARPCATPGPASTRQRHSSRCRPSCGRNTSSRTGPSSPSGRSCGAG